MCLILVGERSPACAKSRAVDRRGPGEGVFDNPHAFVLHGMWLGVELSRETHGCRCTVCSGTAQEDLAADFEMPYNGEPAVATFRYP